MGFQRGSCRIVFQKKITMRKHILKIVLLLVVLVSCGCRPKQPILEETVSFTNHAWNRFNKVPFKIAVRNPDTYYDILLRVSFIDGFPYDEIPVNTVLKSPDGQVNVMRKVLGTHNADGGYAGSVYGDVWTVEKAVHSHRKFGKEGEYTFEVEHLTQYYDLEGIVSVGCVVVPSKEQ